MSLYILVISTSDKETSMSVTTLAIVSGLLQALGYAVYIWKSLKHEIEPNPTTWFMFAYGTATLTLLEWDRDASWELLVLPVTCAVLSIFVAFLCWKRGKLVWPSHWMDWSAFGTDVLLTLGYVGIFVATSQDLVTPELKGALVLAFLLVTNLSTIVSFIPLVRGAYEDPSCEHPLPWLIWASAYATLAYLTFRESGLASEFMIYPASNAVLHGSVGILAIRRWFRHLAPSTH